MNPNAVEIIRGTVDCAMATLFLTYFELPAQNCFKLIRQVSSPIIEVYLVSSQEISRTYIIDKPTSEHQQHQWSETR